MADIKFSQFTLQTDFANVSEVVGYDGATNVRITPSNLISTYLLSPTIVVGDLLEATGGIELGKNAGTPYFCNGATIPGNSDLFFGSNAGFGQYFRNLVLTTEGYFGVNSALGAGVADILRLETDSTSANIGELELGKYGVGTFTGGTPVYNLGVDAAGVVIETALVDPDTVIAGNVLVAGQVAIPVSATQVKSSPEFTVELGISGSGGPLVGLGLSGATPTKGAVEVNTFLDYNSGASFDYFLFTGAGGPFLNFAGVGAFPISVWGVGRFMGSGIHIYSDERIKKDISVSNSKEDLETISKIEISNYQYIDPVKGTGDHKKVIAQQVEKHYPLAVNEGKEIIPDVFKKATITDGVISLSVDCKIGDKVKLIYPGNKEEIVKVVEVNKDSIKVDSTKAGDVIVYGKEVDDYKTVDYDALSMLNISATQELYKIIKELKEELRLIKAV